MCMIHTYVKKFASRSSNLLTLMTKKYIVSNSKEGHSQVVITLSNGICWCNRNEFVDESF